MTPFVRIATIVLLALVSVGMSATCASAHHRPVWAVFNFQNDSPYGGTQLGVDARSDCSAVLEGYKRVWLSKAADVILDIDTFQSEEPLGDEERLQLDAAVKADAAVGGEIPEVKISGDTVTVAVMPIVYDLSTGAMIDEALAQAVVAAKSDSNSDIQAGVEEALRQAVLEAVEKMVSYTLPTATVAKVTGDRTVMIDKGTRDGIVPGMEMAVFLRSELIDWGTVIQSTNKTATMAFDYWEMHEPGERCFAVCGLRHCVNFSMNDVSSPALSSGSPLGIEPIIEEKDRCDALEKSVTPNTAWACLDFQNDTPCGGPELGEVAGADLRAALAAGKQETVVPRSDVYATITSLDLKTPYDIVDLQKVGSSAVGLAAGAIVTGEVLTVERTDHGHAEKVTIAVRVMDVASGELINGSLAQGSARIAKGDADGQAAILEATANAVHAAVNQMDAYHIPEATVVRYVDPDNVLLDKGSRDGLKPGMKMLVLRHDEEIGSL